MTRTPLQIFALLPSVKRAATQGAVMQVSKPAVPTAVPPFKAPPVPETDYAQNLATADSSKALPAHRPRSITPIETMQHAYGAQTGPVIDSARSYQAAHPEIAFPNQLDDATLNKHVPVNIAAPGTIGAAGPDEVPPAAGAYSVQSQPGRRDHISIFDHTGNVEGIRQHADHEMLHQTQDPYLSAGVAQDGAAAYTMSPAEMGARIPALNRAYVAGGQPFPKTPEDADRVLQFNGIPPPHDLAAEVRERRREATMGIHFQQQPDVGPPSPEASLPTPPLHNDMWHLKQEYLAQPFNQQKQTYDKWRSILPGTVQTNVDPAVSKQASTMPPMSIPFKAVMAFAVAEHMQKRAEFSLPPLNPEAVSMQLSSMVHNLPFVEPATGSGAIAERALGTLGGGAAGALTGGTVGWTLGHLINALRGQASTPKEQKHRDTLPATLGWSGLGGGLGAGLVRGGFAGAGR